MGQKNFIGVIGPRELIELLSGLGLQVVGGDQFPAHAHAIKAALDQHGTFPVVVVDLADLERVGPWANSLSRRCDVRVIPGPGETFTGNQLAVDLPITAAELLSDFGIPVALSDLADISIGFGGIPAGAASAAPKTTPPTAAVAIPYVDFDAATPAQAQTPAHAAEQSAPAPEQAVAAPQTPSPEVTRAAAVPSEAPRAVSPGAGPPLPAWLSRINQASDGASHSQPAPQQQFQEPAPALEDAPVAQSPLPEFARPQPKLVPEPIPQFENAQPQPLRLPQLQPQQWSTPVAPDFQPAPTYGSAHAPQIPAPAPEPWMQAPAPQPIVAVAPVAVQAPQLDPSAFFDQRNQHVQSHIQSRRNPQVIISWAAKGGVGKTSFALMLAEIAGQFGLKAVVVDANRGQPNIGRYTRATNVQLPSIYDAARNGWQAAVVTAETLSAVRGAHGPVHFDTVFGPPEHLASPENTPASLYAGVVDELTRNYDLVIIDTQIAEAHLTDLWLEVMIPQLRSDAWAIGLFDSSPPSLPDLKSVSKALLARGVSNAKLLAIGNRWPAFSEDDGQFISRYLTGTGRFLGTALEDEYFKDQSFGGFIPTSSETVRPVLNEALRQVTGDVRFAPEAVETKKRGMRLFGRGKR